jgi:hypothetical protein
MPPSSIAFCAACASSSPRRRPCGHAPVVHFVISGFPPCDFAATSFSFCLHSVPRQTPRASWHASSGCRPSARVRKIFDVSPHTTSQISHGTPSTSAPARCTSITDSVPRLPMPEWKRTRPSGVITINPSNPIVPPTSSSAKRPRRAPSCRLLRLRHALLPLELLRALSSACFIKQLVV